MSMIYNTRKIPDYEHLPLSNAWMFGEVMRQGDNARLFLEELLHITIDHVEYIDKEKVLSPSFDTRGIRMDVYLKDDLGTVYNIEMQTTNEIDNARRIRYYQSMIDTSSLQAGMMFSELPTSFIIFICTFDVAKQGCPIYQKHVYLEGKGCKTAYDDGTHVIFLNTEFAPEYENEVSECMREFLRFVTSKEDYKPGNFHHSLTQNIARMVDDARRDPKRRADYMFTELFIQEKYYEGKKQGRLEGREEGRLEAMLSLYQKGVLPLEVAAAEVQLTPEGFLEMEKSFTCKD